MGRQAYDKRRGNRHARGYGAHWARESAAYLREYPWCRLHRRAGQTVRARHVDHIEPVDGPDDARFWDRSNWQGLCQPCHNAKTRADETGRRLAGCDARGVPVDPKHPWARS